MFRQRQKLPNIFHAKAKIAGMADEVQPTHRAIVITALPTFGAARWGNKIVLLIKPNGWDFDPGEFGKPAMPISTIKFSLNL